MSTIPASQIVQVTPSVVSAGGGGLTGTGLMLTASTRPPIGAVVGFATQAAVASYFGATSQEAAEAAVYFGGFSGASQSPASLLFAQYNTSAVSAYLRGGNVGAALTLAQLQALSGSLTITMDGYARSVGTIVLSGATSYSGAGTIIQTAINGAAPTLASFTAALGSTFTASASGTTLAVTAVAAGVLSVGDSIAGSGILAGTTITAFGAGTSGGTGTYTISQAQTIASETMTGNSNSLVVSAMGSGVILPNVMSIAGVGVTTARITAQPLGTAGGTGTYTIAGSPQQVNSEGMTAVAASVAVTYDSVSGGFVFTSGATGSASTVAFATGTLAAPLLLTSATGAVTSQGAAAATPSPFMTALITQNSNWMNFMTIFDPDGGSGNAQKQAFAAWKNTALGGNRFGYVCWDPDSSPAAASSAPNSLGAILAGNQDSGTFLVWEGGLSTDAPSSPATAGQGLAAFVLGAAAAINFNQRNGRITFAFKSQPGLVANVTDPTTAGNLIANNYNFYGAYGAANANFIWLQKGVVSGLFKWFDSYINQIWLNSLFQNAFLTLLQNALSIPFNLDGANSIQGAAQSAIQSGLNFGAFAPGTISASEVAQVNAVAGAQIAGTLQSQGYYLQVLQQPSSVRAARGPWAITFWYLDRGSVQSINLSSILVQ